MLNNDIIETLVSGTSSNLSDATKEQLILNIESLSKELEEARINSNTTKMIRKSQMGETKPYNVTSDLQVYTNISEMINGANTDQAGFGTLLDNLYMKNRRYYSIIKDYELMPILIPQINRVLMFLVNECLSPDIQNDKTFVVKVSGETNTEQILSDTNAIRKEMKLDPLLREVYTNRYKLGKEYYLVSDYTKTFDYMLHQMEKKRLNESTVNMSDQSYISALYEPLRTRIDDCDVTIPIQTIAESTTSIAKKDTTYVTDQSVKLNFDHLNIIIERSGIVKSVEDVHSELLSETYSRYKMSNIMEYESNGTYKSLNEAVMDNTKFESIVQELKNKKLQRCTVERLDPARCFQLRIGGKTIGYFYITDINEGNATVVNFAQSLKDQLLKSRAINNAVATQSAEELISKRLAEDIINKFDPNIGVNRIEDIDLLHDFVRNNEVYKGNKRITFYYEDEIFDLSRSDDSILTNGVFFTKLYATLLLNNIMTKVLRGRGRQIHTVRLGASPAVQRYIQGAMASLTMPENNLGTLHGSFEQILNPFNSASDIVIPTEDGGEKYIETDYIPGQDVDMNDDFLRTLLNAIVSSFGLDSAVIDATNGNLQFARTLTMESLQICNNIRNEQQDVHDAWEKMVLEIFWIMGSDDTRKAIEDERISINFFEPKSLILQNEIDEINNAKSRAEAIADIIPQFNEDGSEGKRYTFIYNLVKDKVNIDWSSLETSLKELDVNIVQERIESLIRQIAREYEENIKEVVYGDADGNSVPDSQEDNNEDSELTSEEMDYLNNDEEL